MFRSSFNRHARIIIDTGCKLIGDQPNQEIWPLVSDHLQGYATKNGKKQWKHLLCTHLTRYLGFELAPKIWSNGESRPGGHYQASVFSLPTLSSTSAISSFNKALTEAATEQTPLLCEMLQRYDKAWAHLRTDVSGHLGHVHQDDHFYSKT